jgi:hypothetical protein
MLCVCGGTQHFLLRMFKTALIVGGLALSNAFVVPKAPFAAETAVKGTPFSTTDGGLAVEDRSTAGMSVFEKSTYLFGKVSFVLRLLVCGAKSLGVHPWRRSTILDRPPHDDDAPDGTTRVSLSPGLPPALPCGHGPHDQG